MTRCRSCNTVIGWQQALQSVSRMIAAGLTPKQAKARAPSCYRCTAIMLNERVQQRAGVAEPNLWAETSLGDSE
jgi:hypothetical protein